MLADGAGGGEGVDVGRRDDRDTRPAAHLRPPGTAGPTVSVWPAMYSFMATNFSPFFKPSLSGASLVLTAPFLFLAVWLFPAAILVVGIPIALFIRLLLDLADRM